jgi:hypothetical protein
MGDLADIDAQAAEGKFNSLLASVLLELKVQESLCFKRYLVVTIGSFHIQMSYPPTARVDTLSRVTTCELSSSFVSHRSHLCRL